MESQHTLVAARFANVAFDHATETLRADRNVHPHILAVQAAFWACCIDEMLEQLPGYKSARNTDPMGFSLLGLRMARNAATHGAIVCANHSGGLEWPITYPINWTNDRTWTTTDTVVAALGKPPSPAMIESYETHISGRTVMEPLDAARVWLVRAEAHGFLLHE